MTSIYRSSTMGDIPLSFKGKHLLQDLRVAIRNVVREPTTIHGWTEISFVRGKLAKYMSHMERVLSDQHAVNAKAHKELADAKELLQGRLDENTQLRRELKMARDVIETYRNSGARPGASPVRLAHYTTKQLFEELAKRF